MLEKHIDDRWMRLESSLEVGESNNTRIPGGGGNVEPAQQSHLVGVSSRSNDYCGGEAETRTVEISTKSERRQEIIPKTRSTQGTIWSTGGASKLTSTLARFRAVVRNHQQQGIEGDG
jgi:hypothetical protein